METAASNSREDVTEIDLFELFWSVMAKWRRILVWALIFSLVIGGAGVVSGLLDINDADNLTMTQGQYALLLDTYNLSKSTLNARLRTLNQEVAQLQDYQKQSALYAIDPYHTHVLEVAFFVDTGYEILPENNYQSMDYTPAIVLAYRSALEHLNVESLLAEKRGDSAAIDNIGGIGFLSFSVEAVEPPLQSASSSSSSTKTTSSSLTDNIFVESGLIRMQIFGADAEQTDEILALVESTIRELQPQLSENVHAHSITLVSSTAYDTMASSLIQLHDTIDTSMDELSERLNGTILAYNALTIPQTPKTTTTEVLFRTGVKFLVIGFVVGAFLGFLFYGCAYTSPSAGAVRSLACTSTARGQTDWTAGSPGTATSTIRGRRRRAAASSPRTSGSLRRVKKRCCWQAPSTRRRSRSLQRSSRRSSRAWRLSPPAIFAAIRRASTLWATATP